MSVSKSFLSALTGIALAQGRLDSLGQSVLDFFPEYDGPALDPRIRDVTIRHLLTMRMGIRDESEDDYGAYWELYRSENWIRKTLESPLVFDPGARMAYNTFETHLLSALLTKATGSSTLDFATEFLCRPLGIDVDSWERDPQGYYFGGNAMNLTPRETARLGLLYLHRGRFEGRPIVPETWVELTLTPSTNSRHPNEWGGLKNYNYAWLCWLGQINGRDLFMGYGYGGQFLAVFQGLDLIVVSTAKNEVDPDASTAQECAILEIFSRFS
jgi:CubicO group peptidase (beta-lactamase class C family)